MRKKQAAIATPPIIKCHGLWKTYTAGDQLVHALQDVSLDVFAGELLMLVGPSGCGKTTLISIIGGILGYTKGSCTVSGTELSQLSQDELTQFRSKNIGFCFQSYNLIPMLTAEENVAVPLAIQGADKKESLSLAREMLKKVGLLDKANVFPSQLSGGQQQRIAVARSIIHDPKIIVCDEPTSALDQESGALVMDLFAKLSKEMKKTVIVVTHDSRIFHYADRKASLNDGTVVKIEP